MRRGRSGERPCGSVSGDGRPGQFGCRRPVCGRGGGSRSHQGRNCAFWRRRTLAPWLLRPAGMTRRILLAALLLAAAPRPAHADACSPPRIMVVLDKSSSMQTGTIGGVTKWSIAVDALGTVLTELEDQAEVGLMTFPQP